MKPNIQSRTVFLGDNLGFLRGINSECVDLIYADPPFNKKKEFTAPIGSAAEGAGFLDLFAKEDIKDEWVEEFRQENYELHSFLTGIKAIGNSYNYCYLVYMAVRFIECHRTLKQTGSLYLHCDPTMSWGLRVMLDCIFGEENFRNEIVWCYHAGGASGRYFPRKHDALLLYGKNAKKSTHNILRMPYRDRYAYQDDHDPALGVYHPDGKMLHDWWEISVISSKAKERTGWPTQKPLNLLERVVAASSNPGDLVLDPFCGCATTCIAAERLGRGWVGIDVAKEAWNQIESRLKKEVPADMFRGEPHFSTTPPKRGKTDARPKKYVYVISNPAYPGMYKVGVAANAEARLNQFQTADPKRRYQLEFKQLTAEYKTLEPHIHRQFDGDHEWVPAGLDAIIEAIKNYRPEQR